jgi:hypothetical protein
MYKITTPLLTMWDVMERLVDGAGLCCKGEQRDLK